MTTIYRSLDIGLEINSDGTFEVCVLQPECGLARNFEGKFSPTGDPELCKEIGEEVYSWISLAVEEAEAIEEEEEDE